VPAGIIAVGGLFANTVIKAIPLHVVVVRLGINGLGFTVTVTVKVAVQLLGAVPDDAVTLYNTSIAAFVALLNACPIVEIPVV
jgi:hypothetical protein